MFPLSTFWVLQFLTLCFNLIKVQTEEIGPNNNLSKDQIISGKHSNSIKCQYCDIKDWKYKCPKCNFHSCSLECCKSHKEKYSCDGIRSKVEYVPMEKYGYKDLMSGIYYDLFLFSLLNLANHIRVYYIFRLCFSRRYIAYNWLCSSLYNW